MFYAWKTASDFGNGSPAIDKSTSQDALVKRMFNEHKAFFIAHQIDGAWVDLFTFGPAGNTEGREVSEERTHRYIRSRARRLEEQEQQEISQPNTPPHSDRQAEEISLAVSTEDPAGREQLQLNIDPAVVKAIYEFLALDQENREKAINALTALSVAADPFKSAVQVMLDDSKELVVGFPEKENPSS